MNNIAYLDDFNDIDNENNETNIYSPITIKEEEKILEQKLVEQSDNLLTESLFSEIPNKVLEPHKKIEKTKIINPKENKLFSIINKKIKPIKMFIKNNKKNNTNFQLDDYTDKYSEFESKYV